MLEIRQGDVFWIDFGLPTGSGPGYRHPHVVIQNNVFNASKLGTVVVCSLTSNLNWVKAPGNVLLKKGEANLPKDSVVNITQLVTVDKSLLSEKIGTLGRPRVEQIFQGLRLLIEPRNLD